MYISIFPCVYVYIYSNISNNIYHISQRFPKSECLVNLSFKLTNWNTKHLFLVASHGFRLVEETTRNADRDTNWAHGAGITRHHKVTKGQISHARLEKSPRHMEMTKWFVTSWHKWSSGWSFQLHLRTPQILFWDISQIHPRFGFHKSMISCSFFFCICGNLSENYHLVI